MRDGGGLAFFADPQIFFTLERLTKIFLTVIKKSNIFFRGRSKFHA